MWILPRTRQETLYLALLLSRVSFADFYWVSVFPCLLRSSPIGIFVVVVFSSSIFDIAIEVYAVDTPSCVKPVDRDSSFGTKVKQYGSKEVFFYLSLDPFFFYSTLHCLSNSVFRSCVFAKVRVFTYSLFVLFLYIVFTVYVICKNIHFGGQKCCGIGTLYANLFY